MIKFRLTLDNGDKFFVAARTFHEAITVLSKSGEAVDFERPCLNLDLPEIVTIEVWDTEVCKMFSVPMILKKCDE